MKFQQQECTRELSDRTSSLIDMSENLRMTSYQKEIQNILSESE